jgi:hypothetical protein
MGSSFFASLILEFDQVVKMDLKLGSSFYDHFSIKKKEKEKVNRIDSFKFGLYPELIFSWVL